MKKFLLYFVVTIILAVGIGFSLWRFVNIEERGRASVSPLPDFLTLSKNNQVTLLDLWFPAYADEKGAGDLSDELSAKSILVYDLSNDSVIFEKSALDRLPMASLTKIMTAVIALENKKDDDEYVVRKENLVGENSMGLSDGEVLNLEDLLHGLLLVSGNDAAEVLADNHRTGRDGFISDMNKKANALGLTDTKFNNPSGLADGYEQYTTTYDLLVITRYALENHPDFARIVATHEYAIPVNSEHNGYHLFNETNLLTTYEGVKGVKTGYTAEAGLCLVTYLEYDGHKIVAIMLNSENRREEMIQLLNFALESYDITPPEYKG